MNARINIDFNEMERAGKSHDAAELAQALVDPQLVIWELDSGCSGNDDWLIYPLETAKETIMDELNEFFELDGSQWDWDTPNHWNLTLMDIGELEQRYRTE